MRNWWLHWPLKLRLAIWFALACTVIILLLAPLVYGLIKHRLFLDLDRQLRVDWDLVALHLEVGENGNIQWRSSSPAAPDGPGYDGTSFDVWSGNHLLLNHLSIFQPIPPTPPPILPVGKTEIFRSLNLPGGHYARVFEKMCVIDDQKGVMRVYRSTADLRNTLKQVLFAFLIGGPAASLLASAGGSFIAGQALRPVGEMAEQARQISSESLSRRLPNAHPHDELGRLAQVFNETLGQLEDSFEALKLFTADASHELRTPLTALRTVGEVALEQISDSESLRDTISSMLEESRRLEDLVESLLLIARNDVSHTVIRRESVNLADMIKEIRDFLDAPASEKKQVISVELDPGLCVMADRTLLRHIFWNLLHNAIQHNPEFTRIRVSATTGDSNIHVDVADNGPGIAAEHRDRIFERFYRADLARSRETGGFGLGLAIVKLLAERMDGNIILLENHTNGSCFRLTLCKADNMPHWH